MPVSRLGRVETFTYSQGVFRYGWIGWWLKKREVVVEEW